VCVILFETHPFLVGAAFGWRSVDRHVIRSVFVHTVYDLLLLGINMQFITSTSFITNGASRLTSSCVVCVSFRVADAFCVSCSVTKETRMNAQVHDCVKRACIRLCVCVCVLERPNESA